jgi:hypothetical protein
MKKGKLLFVLLPLVLTGCSQTSSTSQVVSSFSSEASDIPFKDAWNYDSGNDVYYQLRVPTCSTPFNSAYETMALYVPGAYFTGVKNDYSRYSCSVKEGGSIGDFNALTAPVVFPVNTPGYASQASPAGYSYAMVSAFLKAGFIYVQAGMRGKDLVGGEAPWGVSDLKAAIRAYRYHGADLPGEDDRFFTFGMSGGGAQSAIVGASGNSPLYSPYLQSIGAYEKDATGKNLSDATSGAMCWCPITSLDVADEAYEWGMGQFFSSASRIASSWESALSKDMADSYASFINALGLQEKGTALSLSSSAEGHFLAGNYYDYLVSLVATSLNNYLSDTYSSVSDKASYVASLGSWASFDSESGTASIQSLGGFIEAKKNASKPVGAFDSPTRGQGENSVFRLEDATTAKAHFDTLESTLLETNNDRYSAFADYHDYRSDFTSDLALKDKLGTLNATRVDLYNPLYYLLPYYQGNGTSKIAPHWRIRTGITQSDTALSTEANLALALQQNSAVQDVDFATVWEKAHVMAERNGSANDNFISWVESCCQ